MTAIEIKKEINKVLDQIPEKLLGDILELVKEVQSEKDSKSKITAYYKKILIEDSEVLHKLAQ